MPLNVNLTKLNIFVLLQYKITSYKRILFLRLNLMWVQKKGPENDIIYFEVTLFDVKNIHIWKL